MNRFSLGDIVIYNGPAKSLDTNKKQVALRGRMARVDRLSANNDYMFITFIKNGDLYTSGYWLLTKDIELLFTL